MQSAPVDFSPPTSLQRRVRTLGHGLFKLNEARKLLRVRLERGLLDEATTAWVKTWSGDSLKGCDPTLPIDSTAKTELVWSGKAWQLAVVAGPEADNAWLPVLLLLHLPALRGFWRRELRSQRFAWMTKVLPQVWAIDTHTIKPGTVIAGLGITSWADLPKTMKAGRTFEVYSAKDGRSQLVNAENWPAILRGADPGALLLRERFPFPVEGSMRVSWQLDENGRIVLCEA